VDADALIVPVVPVVPPKTAMPVSSRRLCGGKGTVIVLPLLLAAPLEAVDVALVLVDGVHAAVALAPSTVPTLPTAAVPVFESVVPPVATPLLAEPVLLPEAALRLLPVLAVGLSVPVVLVTPLLLVAADPVVEAVPFAVPAVP